jgi:type VI secretion system secreted protein VgrG
MDGNKLTGLTDALSVFGAAAQETRLLRLDFPRRDGPPCAMLVNSLVAHEELSRDFEFDVEVLSDDARIHLTAVMGKMVTISLVREDGTLRYFNGYVFAFAFTKSDGGFAWYRMVLRPWLAYLDLRQNCHSFHGRSVLDIAQDTFNHYLERDWRHYVRGADPQLTCANQYNETDHNHLHRRFEALGLHYWYTHRFDGHTLCVCDDSTRAAPIEGAECEPAHPMRFHSEGGAAEDDGVRDWAALRRIGSGSTTLGSFDYKNPRAQLVGRDSTNLQGAVPQLEVYESTGAYGYKDSHDGDQLAKRRMQERDAGGQHFEAGGNDRMLRPRLHVSLSGHVSGEPRPYRHGEAPPENIALREYLVLSVTHTASNNYQAGPAAASRYANTFRCIRKSVPWRPGRGHNSVQPVVSGVHTAIVVGPPGESIHTDALGRIKVQHHWDRAGKFDAGSSAWVRVMTGWAGSGFGQISLPRIGQEVVLQYLEGNIDLPIVIGSVYNATHLPPWELPLNRTQSGVLSRSTPDGMAEHANALRFEDEKGQEQLWLHAERDQLTEVERDEDKWVGNDRRKTVDRDETSHIKRDRTEVVGRDEDITVRHDRRERVDRDEDINIGGNRNERVGGNDVVSIDGMRSERVVLAKEESIGLGKALTIGGVYQTSVGGAMNTTVGKSQFTEVVDDKVERVGRHSHIEARDSFSVTVGAATFLMTADGSISLNGTKIDIDASGAVHINGKDVDVN